MRNLSPEDIRALNQAGWCDIRVGYLRDHVALRTELPIYTLEVALSFSGGSLDVLASVAAMLKRLCPTDPDLPVLYAAAHALRKAKATPTAGPGKGKSPKISVPRSDIPEHIIERIGSLPISARTKKNYLDTLRQVYGAARRSGLADAFDRLTLAAFREELDERGASPTTIHAAMAHCLSLGRLFGLEDCVLDLIRNEMNSSSREAKRGPNKRKCLFRANPITPLDYARKAHEISQQAHSCKGNRQTRHRLFITAAILAFLSWIPDRVGDILRLVVGQNIIRVKRGWQIDFRASKTNFDMAVPALPDQFTPYLDDLILLGTDPGIAGEVLNSLYRQRVTMESPLFARISLRDPYSSGRIFELVKAETGHGPHAARKAMPDYCAEIGMDLEDAMLLLGHRSSQTTKDHYEVNADKYRRKRNQDKLSAVRSALLSEDTTFRTQSGRLVDIPRINKALDTAVRASSPNSSK